MYINILIFALLTLNMNRGMFFMQPCVVHIGVESKQLNVMIFRYRNRGKKHPKQMKSMENEKEQQMEKLRQEKNSFKPGEWNPRAVLMGGLGKDPSLEEIKPADSSLHLAPPASEETKQSPRSKTRVTRRGHSGRSLFING